MLVYKYTAGKGALFAAPHDAKGNPIVSAGTAVKSSADEGISTVKFELDRKQPVGEQIYEVLKHSILTVQLLPGTSISENTICRHFGVSRTPVRSAIVRLAEEGLIDVYPQQGSFVAPIRLSGITDSHFIRKSLEVSLLREAARAWTAASSSAAQAIIASQEAAIAAGDLDLFHHEDERFHHAFAIFAGREGVWSTILIAKARLGRFVRLFGKPERLPVVAAEHRAIVEALDAGDPEEATKRLEYHLDKIFNMLDQLPEQYRPYVVV
jgi:DNA-binding GntR family transcriptional regulator